MSILDNKKKLKDTVDGYAITILKYKTSNKPNKFNSSSNELKKDYKKLTKLRKDLNDLDDSNEDDKETKQFIKQISLSVANSIKEYEQVLLENGESIMDPSIVNNSNDSDNVNDSSSNNVSNNNNTTSNSNGNVANGAATSASAPDSTKISKKEQRKLMKERKNQMKLQAKLAQQEAFNNKQIMITERSAKDIVIDIPEPTTGENDNSEGNKKDNNDTKKNDNDNVRVEHVPKSKKSEDKKKKKQLQQPSKSATTPSSSPFTTQLNTVSLSPGTPLTRAKTADKLTEELLNKSRNQHSSTASSLSSSSAAIGNNNINNNNNNTSSAHSQQVEWGQLATQRKQKELQEKERELQEQEAAQLAAAQAASLEEQARQQQNNLANPSVLLTRQLPQLNNREFLEETIETNDENNVSGYDSGEGCEYLIEGQKLIVNFDNKSNYGLVNSNDSVDDLGFSGGLASIMKDYLTSRTLFFQSNNNTSKENNNSNLSQNNGTWFDFKSYEFLNSDKNGEYTNGTNSNNSSSSNNNAGSNGGDQGIVITGRRQDKEDGNDSEKGVQTQREAQLNIFSPPRESFVRFFIEQC
ncbi:hypothetical protein HANVADRAFT_7229 [Hanseniaspora valbyensis NRRL Y-1626]|uniref:Uncharacterized protein n=1 Tax=Hanseniaspora valbyensis NRRL Y-1626 TaxID=766949 RepID=A0A1B7TC66_9ASCO|nr:hypothetical protein HANVADRAFT_7229 [Hanseniaspora valbyensis NRRL Y-1626]